MGQIILNWLAVLFLPLLLGAAMRAACRRFSKAWLITAAGALLSAVTWFTACHPPILARDRAGAASEKIACSDLTHRAARIQAMQSSAPERIKLHAPRHTTICAESFDA